MKTGKIDVVVAGHLCLDIIPKFPGGSEFKIETLFVPGKLIKLASHSKKDASLYRYIPSQRRGSYLFFGEREIFALAG